MTRLLLVEDDEILGDGLKKVLQHRGEEVTWVKDGPSALASITAGGHELLLLDLNLPGISGFDVVRSVRSSGNEIPILVLTARGEIADRVRALDSGADDYIVKPFDIAELGARIRALKRRASGILDDRILHGDLVIRLQQTPS